MIAVVLLPAILLWGLFFGGKATFMHAVPFVCSFAAAMLGVAAALAQAGPMGTEGLAVVIFTLCLFGIAFSWFLFAESTKDHQILRGLLFLLGLADNLYIGFMAGGQALTGGW